MVFMVAAFVYDSKTDSLKDNVFLCNLRSIYILINICKTLCSLYMVAFRPVCMNVNGSVPELTYHVHILMI